MDRLYWLVLVILAAAWLATSSLAIAQSVEEPAVQAVLFYSPTCPHCHEVIKNTLVPMVDKYGDRLQILAVDVAQPGGQQLYLAAVERYQIQQQGVPTLIIGEVVLIGGLDIPEQFPALVEAGLAAGGVGWPDIPGLAELLPAVTPPASTPTPAIQATTPASAVTPLPSSPMPTLQSAATLAPTLTPMPPATATPTSTAPPPVLSLGDEVLPPAEATAPPPDPLGFTLAGSVLVGMMVALNYAAWQIRLAWPHLSQLGQQRFNRIRTWAVPGLALLGLGVATYLAYVEITHVEAICGPIGECNIVQTSPYAQIFGIPIAVLGVLYYLAVGFLWAGQKYLSGRWAGLAGWGLLGLTLASILFSIYLTYLELFVIRAICAWCVSSAVITTLLLLWVVLPLTRHPSRRQAAVEAGAR